MRKLLTILAVAVLPTSTLLAQSGFGFLEPTTAGYVTSIEGPTFTVAGYTIRLAGKAKFFTQLHGRDTSVDHLPDLYLGEIVGIWGPLSRATHAIAATKIIEVLPVAHKITGGGIIQALLPGATPGDGPAVRADGFLLHLSPTTRFKPGSTIATLAAVTTNQWIEYKGTQLPDSSIDVTEAIVTPNQLDPREQQRRAGEEFTPSATPVKGSKIRQLPLHDDPALQARVDRVGASLVPAYQRALSGTDPTKIDFRFFVVDPARINTTANFDNGILLVSASAATRLTDDSQLAELLATGIAATLEEQETPGHHRFLSANRLASIGAGTVLLGPIVGGLLGAGLGGPTSLTRAEEQCDRESLWLLHDAGYTLAQAPHAWWTLAAKPNEAPNSTPETVRTDDVYKYLGLTWSPRS